MFEKEIKFIYDFNLNKLSKFGSFFSFEQLRESDIHPAILQYISAELDYLIFEDRQKLVKDSIFDYSGEKVKDYFSLINEELKKSKRLSSDYVAKIILHSISFNINFLVRPKWALAKFIYEDESHRTSAEIKQILNYLFYYKYLRKILVSFLNRKKIISMNSVEFVELLNKIDEVTIQSNYSGMLSTSLKSMAEFFNIGGVHRTKVPFNAVQMFLEDKGLDNPLSKLREEFADETTGRLEINDIQKLLTSVLVKRIEVEPEPEFEEKIMEKDSTPISHSFADTGNEVVKTKHKEFEEEPETNKQKIITSFADEKAEETRRTGEDFGIREVITNDTPDNDIEDESDHENIIESAFKWNEKGETSFEIITEMEGLIEEDENSRLPKEEMLTEKKKEDYDDWVFVEEEEHKDLIKEITEPHDGEVKKGRHGRKKIEVEEKEEPTLFAEERELSFGDVLMEEEQIYKDNSEAGKKYDETHRDFSKLLEHKNMSKIVDVLFDCDIEEVELMLNSISFFSTYPEAENFIDTYFLKMGIKPESPDAITFKEIIKENYSR